MAQLRAAQKEWAGYLDEENLRRAIEENRRIQSMPEARSNNLRDSNITYSRGQGLLPDQLLQTGVALNLFNLYSVGGKILGAVPVLLTVYTLLTAVLWPVIYRIYRHKQIS